MSGGGGDGFVAIFLDLFSLGVLLLAVPAFIFISCFIFVIQGAQSRSLRKRISRMSLLAAFWAGAYIIFYHGYAGIISTGELAIERPFYVFFRAGGTVFYFFVSLALCLVVVYLYSRMGRPGRVAGYLVSLSLLLLGALGPSLFDYNVFSVYWAPTSFFLVALSAAWAANNIDRILLHQKTWVIASFAVGVFLLFLEYWFLPFSGAIPGQDFSVPSYSRLSLVFLSFSVVVWSLACSGGLRPLVSWGGENSLALYCLHPFLLGLASEIIGSIPVSFFWAGVLRVILVVSVSYALAFVLKRWILRPALL